MCTLQAKVGAAARRTMSTNRRWHIMTFSPNGKARDVVGEWPFIKLNGDFHSLFSVGKVCALLLVLKNIAGVFQLAWRGLRRALCLP